MLLKGWLWKIMAGGMALLAGISYLLLKRGDRLQRQSERLRVKAEGEEAARKHVQETVEKTREVEDDIERTPADKRRDSLRDYTSGPRD